MQPRSWVQLVLAYVLDVRHLYFAEAMWYHILAEEREYRWWGADVVVWVVFPVLRVQNGTWRAVCGVGAGYMHRLCFPIAMYSMYMDMGGGAGTPPAARLGGC